jgi:hypothetical protein
VLAVPSGFPVAHEETNCEREIAMNDPITKLEVQKYALLAALKLAIRAMNNIPSFDTGIFAETPEEAGYRRRGTLSSYKLLPHLQAVVREAEGQQ